MRGRPRLAVSTELEEYGFGVLDWRAVPRRLAVELLHAAVRIARDGHTVTFTGRRYRTGAELTVDSRPTATRYLTGRQDPAITRPAELLAATLARLPGSATHIAVVCAQPELNQPDAAQAAAHWRSTLARDAVPGSVDIYGHDWALHQ